MHKYEEQTRIFRAMKRYNVMIKPASSACNMRCRYCFYADESCSRQTANYGRMPQEVSQSILEKFLSDPADSYAFAFQGGEPTLAGLPFFEEFVRTADAFARPGARVRYAIQTNGLLIDGAWAEFLRRRGFLVGLSIDGTRDIHNHFRPDAAGRDTYSRALRCAQLLGRQQVPFNILTVVTPTVAKHISAIFRDYQKNGFAYQQYIPCLAPLDGSADSFAPDAKLLGTFWKQLFDLWYKEFTSGNYISIRFFDNLVYMLQGREPELCSMCGHCNIQYLIEADGSVFPCDFYALDAYRLGNILTDSLEDIDRRRNELQFIQSSLQPPEACRRCQWGFLCRNGCRRERAQGPGGKNLYCEGYQDFFTYAYERLRLAAIRNNR